MTRDEVVRLAREATNNEPVYCRQEFTFGQKQLERFAALVAAAEREACALIVSQGHWKPAVRSVLAERAAAIRARGKK